MFRSKNKSTEFIIPLKNEVKEATAPVSNGKPVEQPRPEVEVEVHVAPKCKDCGVADESVAERECPFEMLVYGISDPIVICMKCYQAREAVA